MGVFTSLAWMVGTCMYIFHIEIYFHYGQKLTTSHMISFPRDLFLHQKFIHLIISWPRWKYFTSSLRMPSCVVIVLDQAVVWWWPNKVLLITINGSDTITTVGRRRHHRRTFLLLCCFSQSVVFRPCFMASHRLYCRWIELDWIVIVSGDVKMLWHFGYIQFFSVIWSHSLLCKSYDLIIF